jgi:ferric-dicitrate binding protein FerR (iron transport regulator)
MNDKLIRLAHLYEKYTNGNCTPQENAEFMTLVNEDESVDELNRLIEKDVVGNREEKRMAAPRANQLFDLILQNAKKQEDHSRPVSKVFTLRRMAAAASVIFLLGLGTYFMLIQQKEKTNTSSAKARFKNDVAPGGNKAILTLADGSSIVLDTATNGILAAQGGIKVIKLENGELAYNATDAGEGEVLYNTITTPRGGQYQLVLADGSKVWLNASSSLRFPATFTGDDRKVALTGEAYFEVAKNAKMPFRVTVAGMEVEVLGTHFNINSYDDESAIKTTLVEGAVNVKKGDSRQLLAPGQQLQVDKAGQMRLIKNVDTDEAIAWKNGKFIFSGNDIQSVMRQLEKWYDIDVEYKGTVTKEEFVGMISRSSNISQILQMLEKTRTVKFEINGQKVIVQ